MAYQFRVDNNHWHTEAEFTQFVVNELRPLFPDNGPAGAENVTVWMQVVGDVTRTLRITYRCADYYVTGFQDHDVPADLINYGESAVKISRSSINAAFDNARAHTAGVSHLNDDTIKVMAFLFSETARFASINHLVSRVWRLNDTLNWSGFRPIIRNWSNISAHAVGAAGAVPAGSVQNAAGTLISPIEPGMIKAYGADQAYFPVPSGMVI